MPDAVDCRPFVDAERYTPELLQKFLMNIEETQKSVDVWNLLVSLGKRLDLPFVDFISASSFADWKKTLFIRTSYDSSWLNDVNRDPDLQKWSYFRNHGMHYLTPIMVGIDFVDEYWHIPEKRVEVMHQAASKGMRAGFSIPLRHYAPPQAAQISFMGDHSKREMKAIVHAHGWTLNVAAVAAHQRYMMHFAAEFPERNQISLKQRELLEKIGLGLQDKKIAENLGISVSAVRQRMQLLLAKTGMSNRSELVALAMSIGVLPDPLNRPDSGDSEIIVEMDSGTIVRR